MGKRLLRGDEAIRAVAAVPAHQVAEVLDGELHVSPRPRSRHVRAGSRLGMLLGAFDRETHGPGGWVLLDEPELHLGSGPDILVPDLAGWRRERMPEIPDTACFTLAPDWVCEVLSPSTERVDRDRKLPIYAREGVRHVWLVDPEEQRLEILALDAGRLQPGGTWTGDATPRIPPFEAEPLALAELWAR